MKTEDNKKQEELTDDELNEINGGHWWEKLAEFEKRTNKHTSDTGNLSLY